MTLQPINQHHFANKFNSSRHMLPKEYTGDASPCTAHQSGTLALSQPFKIPQQNQGRECVEGGETGKGTGFIHKQKGKIAIALTEGENKDCQNKQNKYRFAPLEDPFLPKEKKHWQDFSEKKQRTEKEKSPFLVFGRKQFSLQQETAGFTTSQPSSANSVLCVRQAAGFTLPTNGKVFRSGSREQMPDELGGPCRCLAFSWFSANRWTFLLHSFSYLFCHCTFLFPTHSYRTQCCSHCTHGRLFPRMQEGKLLLYYYYWHCWKSSSSREESMQRL